MKVRPLHLIGLLIGLSAGCGPSGDGEAADQLRPDVDATSTRSPVPGPGEAGATPDFSYAGPVLDLPQDPDVSDPRGHETERDWAIAAGTVAWARVQGLGALPVGEIAAILGTTFVGTPYEPGTLELPGPEALVVNLETFDCVTFLEQVLVLAHLVRDAEVVPATQADSEEGRAFRARYREILTDLRYRDAAVDGYGSRLHYFTEWMDQAVARGWAADVTGELGGIPDSRPVDFMSSNPASYRQLAENPLLIEDIRTVEARLSAGTRLFVPQARIADVEEGIRNGDLIAAVSTLEGLDIAHTGIALRHEGRVHLLHAPLVGDSVEISAQPLADRIRGIAGQQGIRILRPLDR